MGARSCPGASMSMKIGPQIIQKLLQNFDIVLSREPVIKRRVELTPADNKMFFNVKEIQNGCV
jgi:cytochrome P450